MLVNVNSGMRATTPCFNINQARRGGEVCISMDSSMTLDSDMDFPD